MSEGSWIKCTVSGETPGPRYGCSTCNLGNGLYLYGGAQMREDGSNQYFGDLFLMTLSGTQISSKRLKTMGADPGPRVGASLISSGNSLYLVGGTKNEFTLEYCSGVFRFDVSNNTWYEITTQDDPCIVSNSMSLYKDTIYTFGGVQLDEPCNHIYSLTLDNSRLTAQWQRVDTGGGDPLPRVDHSTAVLGDLLYVFGGSGSHNLWYNDLHVFDLKTTKWCKLEIPSDSYPAPCDFSTLLPYENNYLILFGGSNDGLVDHQFNDVWYYSMSASTWYKCDVLGTKPPPRHVHSAVLYNDLMYVYGGLGSTTLDDMWVLQLHSNNLRGRSLPECAIENPPPPTTQFIVQETIPLPSPDITIFEIPEMEKHTGLDTLKDAVIGQISKGFAILEKEYAAFYKQKEELEIEKLKVEKTKKDLEDWVKFQRDDLVRQCEEHTKCCQEWADLQTQQFGCERTILLEERQRLARAQLMLSAEQNTLNKRVQKLEEIMSRAKIRE